MRGLVRTLSVIFFLYVVVAVATEDLVFPGNWDLPTEDIPESDFAWKQSQFTYENTSLFLLEKMDNGGWLILNFFTFHVPIGQGWGTMATLIESDGKRYFFKKEIPKKEVEIRPDSAFIRMGKCIFDGKAPTYNVRFETDGFVADLTFNNMVPTWKPGDGVTYFNESKKAFHELYMICPFSRVAGTISYNGKTIDAAGWGYGDRAHSNLNFFRQNRFIYAVRGFPKKDKAPRYAISMLEYIAHPYYGSLRIPTIIIMSDKEFLIATKNYKLKLDDYRKDPNTGYTYPWRLEISGEDRGYSFRLYSQARRVEEVLDVINELPSYLRPIARKFFARPVFYRFSGSVTGIISPPDGPEIHLDLHGYSEVSFVQTN